MHSSVYAAFQAVATTAPAQPFLHLVADTARRYGMPSGELSYGEALERIERLIRAHAAAGARSGQRVALALDNRPAYFLHWLALNALGVSVVPLNADWQAAELEYVLEHSGATSVICLRERCDNVLPTATALGLRVWIAGDAWESAGTQAAPAGQRDDTECALLYTSGTTGRPKGCMLSNAYFLSSGQWYLDIGGYCALKPGEDRLITPLPMYHMNAMAVSTMAMILTGGCVVPLDRFHPDSWWDSVRESRATIIHYLGVMPVMLMGLPAQAADRNHHVRFGFGAGLSGELHRGFEARFGFPLIEAWAMTETGCSVAVIANHEPRKVGTACFGRPPDHLDYRLVDENGNDVAAGQPGELLVRRRGADPRYGLFSGYLKDDAATQAAWAGGYFHTGDLVRLDEDGLFHFVDRRKNVIRRSGENISAVEVEQVLLEVPGVRSVAVAAVPDAVRGDEVCACVVSDVAASSWPELVDALVEHSLHRLAYYKAPGYVVRCEALPLTATEKIQRGALKTLAAERVAAGDCTDTRARKVRRG
ncbi:MAG: AMP-binding protein [Pseudomonadales bacterium]|nr:AMP-binding protein [Pseudomonadales bacterium]